MTQTVAALFVDPKGVYSEAPGVELWDEARDARLYAGPWPVVAHPPCNRWSIMALCRNLRDGQDEGCFAAALKAVRRFGGILEHPAHSLAWQKFELARPSKYGGWNRSLLDDGWVCMVDQGHYGHECRKLTWLYVVGAEPAELIWGDSGKHIHTVRNMHRAPKRGADRSSARSRTPSAFRDVLLGMARTAQYAAG